MAPADGSGPEVLYGMQAVREALRAGGRPVAHLLLVTLTGRSGELAQLARSARIPVRLEPRQALDRLVGHDKHQGVVAVIAASAYVSEDEILAAAKASPAAPLLVVLDGVEDPHNLGAVLRSAEAAGAHGVFIPERRAVGLTPVVAKASAGAVEHLRVARVGNCSRLIERLQADGLWVYGLDPGATTSYADLDLTGPTALVFGGEGKGIRQGVLEKCDGRAAIPMRGRVSSLNVSAAAAIVLFEALRQRQKMAKR